MKINDIELNATLEQIIEELKNQLKLNGLNYFGKIKNSGKDIMVSCPYHKDGQERKPSAGIRKSDGQFHCFACNETHSLPEVISHCFGKDDIGSFGWKWLLQNFGTVTVEERKSIDLDFGIRGGKIPNNLPNKNIQEQLQEVFEKELDSYRYIHPYMYKRKLTDEIIEMFDIGYDKMSDCITFPVRDINGNVLAVARRSTKVKWFNYPSGFEKPLYGLYEYHKLCTMRIVGGRCNGKTEFLRKLNEVVVCESMLDALTCWVYGKYAVALNGLGTELQFRQLRELPCRKLILATDNDEAGQRARKRIRQNVKNKIITEYILPDGKKDINELSKEEFDNLIEMV